MGLKRDIYKKLLEWKKDNSGRVMQVSGARQVDKTYNVKKFARENFKHVVYINMTEPSGEQFLQCMDTVKEWEPETPREEKPVHKTFKLYQRIGDYPSVVNKYLEHKSLLRCKAELGRLMEIFTNESKQYFDDVMETDTFEKLFQGGCGRGSYKRHCGEEFRISHPAYTCFKGDAKGGRTEDGKIQTVPLYLADRITSDLSLK